MPSSDSADHHRRTTTSKHHHMGGGGALPPPEQPEHLPCPRCDSTNTKFCYYNNYNFSQPRHFCKACRRYWTHGGTLRDIPVGGGSRKNAKRPRQPSSAATGNSSSSVSSGMDYRQIVPAAAVVPVFQFAGDHGGGGGFTSLLSGSSNNNNGIFGFDQDLSFGLGRTIWPFSDGGHGGAGGGNVNTWQMESGDGGGDCFVLPELGIATRGSGLK